MWGVVVPIWISSYYVEEGIRLRFANEQMMEFARFVELGMSNEVDSIKRSTRLIENYYPSGTKQIEGSLLDKIVERSRKQSIMIVEVYARLKECESARN